MGREAEAVNALRAAEADKSLFNIENDTIGAVLLEAMQADRFTGTTAELLERLKAVDPSLEGTLSVKRLAKRIERLWPHMEATFKARKEKGHGGINQLVLFPPAAGGFGGFETAFSGKSLRERELGDFMEIVDSNQPNQPTNPAEQEFDL